MKKQLSATVIILSLFSTVTNFVPLSVCFVGLFPIFFWKLLVRTFFRVNSRVFYACLLLYLYFLSGVLIYSPSVLFKYEFYRRDGNFFITFLPLLIFPLLNCRFNLEMLCKAYLTWASLVSLLSYVLYVINSRDPIFHGFFVAHNAAGGYFAMLAALSLGMFLGAGNKLMLLFFSLFLFFLIESDSRGSLVGIALAPLILFRFKKDFVWHSFWCLFIGLILLIIYTYPTWQFNGYGLGGFSVQGTEVAEVFDRTHTMIERGFYLWPRAVYLWMNSPFIGTGFGSYNDVPYDLRSLFPFIVFNNPADFISSDAHAHNTFFHVLAETGLVGFALLLIFLKGVDGLLKTKEVELSGVVLGLRLALWVGIWSSFTEHRLFTPSQMLPFTILLALYISYRQSVSTPSKVVYNK